MPGAEGRTGWPWDSLPWQFNWGLLIVEISPFLILFGAILFGTLSNRLRIFRRRRGAIVENMAGSVQDANGPLPYILVGVYIVIAIVILIYTFNNAIYGEQY